MILGVLLPLFGFGGLAEGVWNRGGLGWDTAVLQLLHQHDSAGLDRVAIDVSQMGDIRLVIFFTVAIAIILLVRQRYREERFLANCVVGAAAAIFLVKAALRPVRSHFWEALPPQVDLGSPSAHSMGTCALAMALMVIAWPTRWRWLAIFLGTAYALSVAVSRVYLGVHQESDVMCAWALALAWVCAMVVLLRLAGPPVAPRRVLLGLVASLAAILAGYIASDLAHDNLRMVLPGQAYRAGQMSPNALALSIEEYGIKSILNLRGKNPSRAWYNSETEAAQRLKVVHYDFGISASQELRVQDMDEIARLLQAAPKPVLIHCAGGADRSGLASALYLYAIAGKPAQEADRELSMWNGHVPLLRPSVSAMDHSFWRYVSNRVSRAQAEAATGK